MIQGTFQTPPEHLRGPCAETSTGLGPASTSPIVTQHRECGTLRDRAPASLTVPLGHGSITARPQSMHMEKSRKPDPAWLCAVSALGLCTTEQQ